MFTRVDSLVLNAGVMLQPWQVTVEGLESTMGVNHVGHALLTKLLLPNLQATAKEYGVATVSVTSSAAMYESAYAGGVRIDYLRGEQPSEAPDWYDPFEAYAESKLA